MTASYGRGFIDISPQATGLSGFQSSLAGAMGGIAKSAAAVFTLAFTAAVGTTLAAFKIGSTFEDAFRTIRIGTGAVGDELDGLQDSFREVFGTVPTDAGSASQAIADLNTRLNLTGKPLEDLSRQFLELSRITKTDLESNITTVTRVFGDWGIATHDQSGALDALFRASQATGPSVDRLGQLIVQYGAPLRQLGFGFEEGAALLGKFEKEGVNTELVMGSLRIALGKMAREGEDAQETFRRVTGEIAAAGSASEANALALELFGARAGPDMAAAIREGRFEIDELFATVSEGSETVMGAADDAKAFGERWNEVKNRILLKLEPVATKVFEAFGNAMEDLGPKIERVVDWFIAQLPGAIATARQVAGSLAAWWSNTLLPAIQQLVSWGQTHLIPWWSNTLLPAIQQLVSWGQTHLIPFIQNQVIPAFRAIIAAISGVVGWFKNLSPEQKKLLKDLALAVGAAIVAAKAFLGIVAAFKAVGAAFKVLSALLMANPWALLIAATVALVVLVVRNWDTIRAAVKKVWDWITKTVGAVGQAISTAFRTAVEFVRRLFLNFTPLGLIIKHFDTIKRAASGVKDWIVARFTELVSFFAGMPRRIANAIRGLWDGIKDTFRSAINWVIQKWNNLKIEMRIPAGIPLIGGSGFTINTPNIPLFHEGGIVPGPAGSEMLAILKAGERVLSRAEVAAEAAGSGFSPTFILQGTPQDLVRQVGNEVSWALGK